MTAPTVLTVRDACVAKPGQTITVAGTLTSITHRITGHGRTWASAHLTGEDEAVEILFFPNTYARLLPLLTVGSAVVVTALVNDVEQMPSLSVRDIHLTDPETTR